jgi:hypothetical protein
MNGTVVINLDNRWVKARLVSTNNLDEASVSRGATVGSDNAIGRLLLLAHAHQAQSYGHGYSGLSGVVLQSFHHSAVPALRSVE